MIIKGKHFGQYYCSQCSNPKLRGQIIFPYFYVWQKLFWKEISFRIKDILHPPKIIEIPCRRMEPLTTFDMSKKPKVMWKDLPTRRIKK